MNYAVLGDGLFDPWLDMGVLLLTSILFLLPSFILLKSGLELGN